MSAMDDSGKQRSFAQRVGTVGENAFRNFAERQRLLPTRVEEDFGIDFYCQIDKDADSKSTSSIADTLATAFVRASTSANGRITLTRRDAQNILRARQQMFVVLIHVKGDEDRVPFFRFVDAEFAVRLSDFLGSDKTTHSLLPKDLLAEAEFPAAMAAATLPGARSAVEIALAGRGLEQHVTDPRIEVVYDESGGLTLVTTFQFYEYFDNLSEDDQAQLYIATFGVPDRQEDRLAAIALKTGVTESLQRLPHPLVLGGFVTLDAELLSIVDADGSVMSSCPFVYTRNADHFGWVHPAGMSVTVSMSKVVDDQDVHETDVLFDPDATTRLDDLGPLGAFISMAESGCKLVGTGGFEMDLEYFWRLVAASETYRYWKTASSVAGWQDDAVFLRDLDDYETAVALSFLSKLHPGGDAPAFGFALNPATNRPFEDFAAARDALEPVQRRFGVPVIANTKNVSIIADLTVTGEFFYDRDERSLTGFRAEHIENSELHFMTRVPKSTVYPEVLIHPDWPTLPMAAGEDTSGGTYPADLEGWQVEPRE
jgi:hypothetical protein